MPSDHLAGQSGNHRVLLQALSDDDLADQLDFYRQWYAMEQNPRTHYEVGKLLATASAVQADRVL